MRERPLLLVTNDDGIGAAGLRSLVRALAGIGEVWAVAPAEERSTTSHGVTLRRSLRVDAVERRRYAVWGTPVDAVFVGLFRLVPRRPAMVISGINRGPNLGTDTVYSGTVAAAREGSLRGIPSLAVSLTQGDSFAAAGRLAARVVRKVLRAGSAATADGRGVLLNLNVPPRWRGGLRWVRLGRRTYPEEVALRRGAHGRLYARIGGYPVWSDRTSGTDTDAVARGRASLTALTLDYTQQDARRRFPALVRALEAR